MRITITISDDREDFPLSTTIGLEDQRVLIEGPKSMARETLPSLRRLIQSYVNMKRSEA